MGTLFWDTLVEPSAMPEVLARSESWQKDANFSHAGQAQATAIAGSPSQ
jgi:hypothetical protein